MKIIDPHYFGPASDVTLVPDKIDPASVTLQVTVGDQWHSYALAPDVLDKLVREVGKLQRTRTSRAVQE